MVDPRIAKIIQAHELLDGVSGGLADLPKVNRSVREAMFWLGTVEAPELKAWTCGACEHRWTVIFEEVVVSCPKCGSGEVETTQDYDTYKAAQEVREVIELPPGPDLTPSGMERFARVTNSPTMSMSASGGERMVCSNTMIYGEDELRSYLSVRFDDTVRSVAEDLILRGWRLTGRDRMAEKIDAEMKDDTPKDCSYMVTGSATFNTAIHQIVEYNWTKERDDYADNEESRPSHIFNHLVALANWLEGSDNAPMSWVEESRRRS